MEDQGCCGRASGGEFGHHEGAPARTITGTERSRGPARRSQTGRLGLARTKLSAPAAATRRKLKSVSDPAGAGRNKSVRALIRTGLRDRQRVRGQPVRIDRWAIEPRSVTAIVDVDADRPAGARRHRSRDIEYRPRVSADTGTRSRDDPRDDRRGEFRAQAGAVRYAKGPGTPRWWWRIDLAPARRRQRRHGGRQVVRLGLGW